jgi:peroxin-1
MECGSNKRSYRLICQILVALSGKVPVEDPYDLEEIAQMTEGYSGADLQAVLYNAHLAGIHDFIEEEKTKLEKGKSTNLSKGFSEASQFVEYGGQANSAPMSLADREAFQKRASKFHWRRVQQLIIYR